MLTWGMLRVESTPGNRVTPYSVIDVGSNTIHLLVGEVKDGVVLPVTAEKVSARLGSGVDATGRIEEARIPVAAEIVKLFAQLAALNGASETTVLATSAVRDAENGPVLVEEVRKKAGLQMRLISGEEEAILGFRGAFSALGSDFPREVPALVVDLGGGSAQLIFGDIEAGPEKQISLPLGSNRLTERYVKHDPPEPEELETLRETVLEVLPRWNLLDETAIVAIGGSARAILRLARHQLTGELLEKLAVKISTKPSAVLARDEGLAPERARVLPAAITTLAVVLEHFGSSSITVVRGGIREGAVLTMYYEAKGRENWTGEN
jgi:exopolyphosphatase/guanosine-5'-triphosphate,3'-diphosphate pyrophosphatase